MADPAPLLERARTAAFEDARAKAEQYAAPRRPAARPGAAGHRGAGPRDARCRRFAAKAAMDVGGGMPVEAGESTVTATVTVRFGLG